jgi:hypothetical protein
MDASSVVAAGTGVAMQVAFSDVLASVFVAGMAGGFIRWTRTGGGFNAALTAVLTGGICAQYLGPLALSLYAKWFDVEIDDQTGQVGGFLMGLTGVIIVGLIMDTVEARKVSIAVRKDNDQ